MDVFHVIAVCAWKFENVTCETNYMRLRNGKFSVCVEKCVTMRLRNGKLYAFGKWKIILSYQLSADLTTLWQRWNGFGTLRKGLRYREERIDASRFIEMCILIHWFIHQDEYNILWTWARFDSSFSFRHSNFEFLITSRPQAHTVFRLAFYDNITTWWRWQIELCNSTFVSHYGAKLVVIWATSFLSVYQSELA